MSTLSAESGVPAVRPLWKTFLIFLLPMMGSNVLQSLSGTINNIYLGRMIGVHALSAVSSFFPILFLLISFVIGLGSGASVLIGQAYGANELVRVKAVAGTTLTVTVVLGVIIAAFGGSLTREMLAVLGTPADIIVDATEYARIFLLSVPLLFVFILYTTITRGVGDTRTPFLALIVANAIGLLLTPALIQGWLGLPRLGVASGAAATIVSFFLTLVWLSFYLLRRRHPLAPDRLLLSREIEARQQAAMSELTPTEQTAFILRHMEDRSTEEIAAALNIAPNAAKQAVFRAVQKLRRQLAPLWVKA